MVRVHPDLRKITICLFSIEKSIMVMKSREIGGSTGRFSIRERSILGQLCSGSSPAMIAGELEITTCTVNVHIRSATRKAGLTNRFQLIAFAHQQPECLSRDGLTNCGLHATSRRCHCPNCTTLTFGTRVAG